MLLVVVVVVGLGREVLGLHFCVLHRLCSIATPGHMLPPALGLGLSH